MDEMIVHTLRSFIRATQRKLRDDLLDLIDIGERYAEYLNKIPRRIGKPKWG